MRRTAARRSWSLNWSTETLCTRLEGGPLPQRRAVGYALQMARGIAAAHGRAIMHRDLKPENVMITRDDQVKILDFGLAKSLESTETDLTRDAAVATNAGTVLGTVGYMAPEQVRGLPLDHRADMFAFDVRAPARHLRATASPGTARRAQCSSHA